MQKSEKYFAPTCTPTPRQSELHALKNIRYGYIQRDSAT